MGSALKWVLLLVACGVTAQANAAVTVSIINQGANPKDEFGDTASGFTAYVLQVVADPGRLVTAVDAGGGVLGDLDFGNGIYGSMFQAWDSVSGRGGTTTTATPIEADTASPQGLYSIDSHFLLTQQLTVAHPLTEDNSGVDPPGEPADVTGQAGYYGTGTYLQGSVGLVTGQASTVNVAYIVLPTGTLGTYSLDISTTASDGTDPQFAHLAGVIPEPSMLGSIFAASMVMASRRRR